MLPPTQTARVGNRSGCDRQLTGGTGENRHTVRGQPVRLRLAGAVRPRPLVGPGQLDRR